ncbi:hypothetical protein BGZ72_007022 [Mortierella alpina]|nr:hypothetical protein BGZ72_007022 [Mortierella alpina]
MSADPVGSATRATLLKAVQDQNRRNANIPPEITIEAVQSALKTYYTPDLIILRVSGDRLDLETCYVNLAIVEAPAQREREKEDLKEKAAVFHRISSFEKVDGANTQSSIPLEQIFNKRKLRDGKEDIPKRILVQGRAGIGKTTLCKKLVHAHQTELWRDRFDAVLWLPLRQLKAFKARTLEGLFREKFFAEGRNQHGEALTRALGDSAERGRVLFILDGLDEIALDTAHEGDIALKVFLKTLLGQKHVVVTSRPSGVDRSLLPEIDLELETIGFSQQNVSDFLVKVLKPEAVKTVQNFIQQTPLIQGLVNIPVQLDVICFSWDSLPKDGPTITMTGLYQLMVRKLWCKDALRLKKTAGGKDLTAGQISKLEPEDIDELMATELLHLGYLAFKGMQNNHQIEFDEKALLSTFRDLKGHSADTARLLPPQLLEVMKETSFLHTADVDPDCGHARMLTMDQAASFVQEHKYNPQYEIVWWMVAGLLEGEALTQFFDLLQRAPRDLVGGRHQQVLASCLNEARTRLDPAIVVAVDSELRKWLLFELRICQDYTYYNLLYRSKVGSQFSFPEHILVEMLGAACSCEIKVALANTLGSRSSLSDSAIRSLTAALEHENEDVREAAASALLARQSTLPESATQSMIVALKDKNRGVRDVSAIFLGRHSTLPESAIQAIIQVARTHENKDVRCSAADALRRRSTLSEHAVQSLIAALWDDDDLKYSTASALRYQSTLSESTIHSLVTALRDETPNVRHTAATVLGEQPTLSESAAHSLFAALTDKCADIKYSAAGVLGDHATLPDSIVQSLVAALNDDNWDIACKAATALRSQSDLSSPSFKLHSGMKAKTSGIQQQ